MALRDPLPPTVVSARLIAEAKALARRHEQQLADLRELCESLRGPRHLLRPTDEAASGE